MTPRLKNRLLPLLIMVKNDQIEVAAAVNGGSLSLYGEQEVGAASVAAVPPAPSPDRAQLHTPDTPFRQCRRTDPARTRVDHGRDAKADPAISFLNPSWR